MRKIHCVVLIFLLIGAVHSSSQQQFETDTLTSMANKIVQNEGVLCLEVVADATGEILPHHLEQIKEVGRKLEKIN